MRHNGTGRPWGLELVDPTLEIEQMARHDDSFAGALLYSILHDVVGK